MSSALRKVTPLSALAVEKLATSGITPAQAQALGMYSTDNAATLCPTFQGLPTLAIPYYTVARQPLHTSKHADAFYRVRYLTEPHTFAEAAGKKVQRYTQPPGSGVAAYFALCFQWSSVVDDPSQPLLITEGELKAAKACLEGFATIGLGGVYNYRSIHDGMFFLPELSAINWKRRTVSIVYDSDYVEKPNICAAINDLAEELQERGALVDVVTLPNVYDDGRKTGLDDFLVERGDEALVQALRAAEPLAITGELWGMNEEIVYIKEPGIVVHQGTSSKMVPSAFTAHSTYATLATPERKVSPNGAVSYAKTNAAAAWIKWPLRRTAEKITYAPGKPRFTDECYNQWRGWGCEPHKGSIKPWQDLLKFIFADAEPTFVEWFLDWCAYPLQHPGTKLFSAVVIHGRATGTGKTLLGYTLGKIYGSNFTKIENKHLRRDFNGWAENRQFVLGDEISGSDKRSEADAMKTIITQEEISINVKMLPEYTVPDCINYYFTSNHADAFFIEDMDRRYAVHEVTAREPLPDSFYRDYEQWKEGDGPSALFHYLLGRDTANFNPKARAPDTAAKNRMKNHGKSDLGVWCGELAEQPESKLYVGQMRHRKDLFTSNELLAMYQATNDTGQKVTANGLGRALSAAGFVMAYRGMPIPVDGKQARFYIIRNHDKWSKVKSLKEFASNIRLTPER